jgi:hypothetical protein
VAERERDVRGHQPGQRFGAFGGRERGEGVDQIAGLGRARGGLCHGSAAHRADEPAQDVRDLRLPPHGGEVERQRQDGGLAGAAGGVEQGEAGFDRHRRHARFGEASQVRVGQRRRHAAAGFPRAPAE